MLIRPNAPLDEASNEPSWQRPDFDVKGEAKFDTTAPFSEEQKAWLKKTYGIGIYENESMTADDVPTGS